MADFFETLIEAGILVEGHGYADENAVTKDLVEHLRTRLSLIDEVKELKSAASNPPPADPPSAAAAVANPAPPATPTVTPDSTTGVAVDASNAMQTVRWLQEQGKITFDGKTYTAVDESFAAQASSANDIQLQEARKQSQLMSSLVNSPEEFTRNHLGASIQEMLDKSIKEATEPLQAKLDQYESQFVPLPSEEEQYIFNHHEEWNAPDSKRRAMYEETAAALSSQWEEQNLLPGVPEAEFKRQLHAIVASKTDLMMLTDATSTADPALTNTAPPEPTSLIDSVNAGEPTNESGTRNNGTARQLNEHAQQVGDTSQPITAQGRVDFQAIANKSAQAQGITI